MFRPSYSAVNRQNHKSSDGFWVSLSRHAFLLFYFTLLPVLTSVLLSWAVYLFTRNSLFHEVWMAPALMGLSVFVAGVLIRQKMEDDLAGMGAFIVAILALILFAALTYQDIQAIGGVYSRFMPRYLNEDLASYIYALPAVGIVGMLAYKQFTLKHYS
ncbi:hypothetical protein [Vampirovibrio sp.]|uniref:hypothetical protein n=1 Tax=Vampirovibrio sp. TaxID=2717857 RepID=UPI0035948127